MMITRNISILILATFICSCKTSKNTMVSSPCFDEVSVRYHKASKEDVKQKMVADDKKDSVVIFFEDYFDGIVKAYADKKLIYNEVIVTDESLGTTGKYITYNYSNDKTLPNLKVVLGDNCVDIPIHQKYKLIYVFYNKNKWDIIYSNVFPTYE